MHRRTDERETEEQERRRFVVYAAQTIAFAADEVHPYYPLEAENLLLIAMKLIRLEAGTPPPELRIVK